MAELLTAAGSEALVQVQLGAFLVRAGRTPFVWGTWDCCLWLADWIRERRHIDPAARFRGTYASRREAEEIQREHGGLAGLLSELAAEAGLKETDNARCGDVGIVQAYTPDGVAPVGAIFNGRLWTGLSIKGLVCAPATPLTVWAV